jgi:general secretion pathway protein A
VYCRALVLGRSFVFPRAIRERFVMYTNFFRFFGLRENPFNVNPDPAYLFLNKRTQAVLDDIASAIQARRGLIVLTGEVGTGKTSLVNRLKQWLQKQQTPTAFIFNPHLEVNELFDLMLANFGISADTRLKGSALARLNQWLIQGHQMGRNAVLILDEAQGLPAHVLEEIRMLLNHELENEKLLQIVLSGQPELEEKLKRPQMRQIRQRISLRCQTMPLTLEEAHGYIQKRLRIAGRIGGNAFAPEAINVAYLFSRGIPRVMNLLCEHAMIRAYLEQTQPVSASLVEDVASELQFDDVRPVGPRPIFEVRLGGTLPMLALEDLKGFPAALQADGQGNGPMGVQTGIASGLNPVEVSSVFAGSPENGAGEKPQPKLVPEIDAGPHPIRDLKPELVAKASGITAVSEPNSPKRDTSVVANKNDRRSFLHLSRLRQWVPKRVEWRNEPPAALVVIPHWISDGWRKTVASVKSPTLQKKLDSALRWLQQPLPTVKVHRRAHH